MPDIATLEFTIPQQHPCFSAHFPGNPIVPGALLLQWILTRTRSHYPYIHVAAISSMKFVKSLHPGDHCRLKVDVDTASKRMNIACYHQSELVCKGVAKLAPEEHPHREQLS